MNDWKRYETGLELVDDHQIHRPQSGVIDTVIIGILLALAEHQG